MKFILFIFFLSSIPSISAFGDIGKEDTPAETAVVPKKETEEEIKAREDLKAKTEGRSYLIPAPFYSPETSVGLNLLLFKILPFKKEENDENSSNILAYATYTAKLQFALSITPTYYSDHGKNLFAGEVGFKSWPDQFYSIGNSSSSSYEAFSLQSFYLRPRYYRTLFWNWSAGPFYELENDILTYVTPGGALASGSVPGSSGNLQSGVGIGVRWDDRDIPFFPTKGVLFEGSFTQFSGALGSTNAEYTRVFLDYHKYYLLAPRNTIALEGYFRSTAGNVPFESMSILGGNQYLRGMYGGRFRDKDSLLGQIEYRFPIYKRLGGAAFGGIGEVSSDVKGFDSSHTQSTTGAGLRYFLDVREQLNVRLDFGIGPDTSGVYICAGEAL